MHTYVHVNIYCTSICVSSVAFEPVAQTLKYSLSISSYNHKNCNIYDSLSKIVIIFWCSWYSLLKAIQFWCINSGQDKCWRSKCLKFIEIVVKSLKWIHSMMQKTGITAHLHGLYHLTEQHSLSRGVLHLLGLPVTAAVFRTVMK
jgi:hypothetical protein